MDISTLSGISSLLGGYLKGRQLKQNKDIKAAQLQRELNRDAINLSHQKEMERIAGERLKIAQNPPAKNEDPATRLNYEAGINPILDSWKRTQAALAKAPSRSDQTPIMQGFITQIPQHLNVIRGLHQLYPTMSMGLTPEQKFEQITGIPLKANADGTFNLPTRKVNRNGRDVDELDLDSFIPSPAIPWDDLQKDYDANVRIPGERGQFLSDEALMGAQQAWIKKASQMYGEDVANKVAGVPFGTNIKIGTRQGFVVPQAGLQYSPASPEVKQAAGGLFDPVTGRTVASNNGQNLGMYRAQINPQMMREGFNPTPNGFLSPKSQMIGTNQFGMVPVQPPFQYTSVPGVNKQPIKALKYQAQDPLRIARAIFADEVQHGDVLSITPEQRLIREWMQTTGKNPFTDADAMRQLYSLLPQNSHAKAMFRDVAMLGGSANGEYAPYESKEQDVTYRHTINPTAAVRAMDQRLAWDAETQPWKLALAKINVTRAETSIEKMKSDMANTVFDNWLAKNRFAFERGKFVEEMNLKKDKFSFEKTKAYFDMTIKRGQLDMQQLSTLNGLGASARGVLMGANQGLTAANERLRTLEAQWGMAGQVAQSVDIKMLEKYAKGEPLSKYEEEVRMQDTGTQHVFELFKEIYQARQARNDAQDKVTAAEQQVKPFVEWADKHMAEATRQATENQRKAEAAAKKDGKGQGSSAPGTGGNAGSAGKSGGATRRRTEVDPNKP